MRAPAARSGGAAGVSHDSPRTLNVHISGSRSSLNTTKIPRPDPKKREERNKIGGGRREKKKRNFERSGGGLSSGGGVLRRGGSSGRVHRKWGAGFGVSGSVQVSGDENRNSIETQ